MKRLMMKYLMVSCKKATLLMAKKEEDKLSVSGRIKLTIHISMCSLCKLFEKQTRKISEESKQIMGSHTLSELSKKKMEKLINEQTG